MPGKRRKGVGHVIEWVARKRRERLEAMEDQLRRNTKQVGWSRRHAKRRRESAGTYPEWLDAHLNTEELTHHSREIIRARKRVREKLHRLREKSGRARKSER